MRRGMGVPEIKCVKPRCGSTGWVCETHPDQPPENSPDGVRLRRDWRAVQRLQSE